MTIRGSHFLLAVFPNYAFHFMPFRMEPVLPSPALLVLVLALVHVLVLVLVLALVLALALVTTRPFPHLLRSLMVHFAPRRGGSTSTHRGLVRAIRRSDAVTGESKSVGKAERNGWHGTGGRMGGRDNGRTG